MSRGGRRTGAGRKPGSVTQKTREIAEQASANGITPLEVILSVMRGAWAAGEWALAASYAKDAAPYCHPRLAAINRSDKVVREVTSMTDEELEDIIRREESARAHMAGGSGNGVAEPPGLTPDHR
jgi:hypothetical protein